MSGSSKESDHPVKVIFFDTHEFEKDALFAANKVFGHELTFVTARLTIETASIGMGFECVCAFANDKLDAGVLRALWDGGTRLIALRCAGFNHVDLKAAEQLGLAVVRVPEYSPYAVAEHAVCLMLSLNRKIHRAYNRIRELNFSLEGLVGFDLHGKTVGIIGTGRIGAVLAKIMCGFGCNVLLFDQSPSMTLAKDLGAQYVDLKEIYRASDIISLHIPLTPETRHLIDAKAFAAMKTGVILINTGRGALIDTKALIDSLKIGHVGGAGLDVYEEEENIFFRNLSDQILQDDTLARLLTFPNVVMTSHQAFLTREALDNIAQTTMQNIEDFTKKRPLKNRVGLEKFR